MQNALSGNECIDEIFYQQTWIKCLAFCSGQSNTSYIKIAIDCSTYQAIVFKRMAQLSGCIRWRPYVMISRRVFLLISIVDFESSITVLSQSKIRKWVKDCWMQLLQIIENSLHVKLNSMSWRWDHVNKGYPYCSSSLTFESEVA